LNSRFFDKIAVCEFPVFRFPHVHRACCAIGLALLIAEALPCSPLAQAQSPTELRQLFDNELAAWKQSAKDAVVANENYLLGDADQAATYRDEWIRAIETGRSKFQSLIVTSIKRLREESSPDPEVLSFLGRVLESRYDIGDYEGAYEVGQSLIATVPDAPGLLVRQIFVTFATNRFEECKGLLEKVTQLTGGLPPELASISASIDDQIAAWKSESDAREAEAKADDLPRVELMISQNGTTDRMVLELFENEAPNTVANFISLVEKGFYDGRQFFRVTTHFDAASGCPQDDGTGNPGHFVPSEAANPSARKHFRGSLAMVSMAPDGRAGSQFYMMFTPNPGLNGRATVIGRVVEGTHVLDRITRSHFVDSSNQKLQKIPDIPLSTIESARVLRKRNHEYLVKTIAE
jgi:cyclophilin family peptidyl-prolyl cis-trans isomerase